MSSLTLLAAMALLAAAPADAAYHVDLAVTSELPADRVPMDPMIDFGRMAAEAKLPGVLDPNSIEVIDVATGRSVPCAPSEDFSYGDRGRVQWVIDEPGHKKYRIRFRMVERRPPREPKKLTPLLGTGDLLRYNAGQPRPIVMAYLAGLVDLTGDGRRDLVGCWNYAYQPGWPWDGIICYPRVGDAGRFEFGDLTRIRYVDAPDSTDFKHFTKTYMYADVADLDGDGLPDVVYCPSGSDRLLFYRNSGRRDAGGMPIFVAAGSAPRQTTDWQPCRAVDLNRDGAIDFVVGKLYLKNTNPKGWPVELAKGVPLDVGKDTCFFDVDGDGELDAVSVVRNDATGADTDAARIDPPHTEDGLGGGPVVWRRHLGGDPPRFGPPQRLAGVDAARCTNLAAVRDGERRGLLVQHDTFQNVSFYEQTVEPDGQRRFKRFGRAESESAVVALSDQCWPQFCDWDGDGDLDLLTGDGYGWPKILINRGTRESPALDEAQPILSEGKPIRLLRDQILGGKHWHNMGYSYPAYVDWDADGLPDLMLPNETNRIFWYKNVGTRAEPKFGPRRQVICDGFPDSPEQLAATARLTAQPDVVYPVEKDQPFFWRTGVAFADYNGDGLPDMITADGQTRQAVLFVQYRDGEGTLRLKRERVLKLPDGRPIDETVVGRSNHWTESYRPVDWDGDGLVDLVYSCAGAPSHGSIFLLRNIGDKTRPDFDEPRAFCCFGEPIVVTSHGPQPWVGDLDGDGRPDVLACVEWSVYPFYRHAAIEMRERPRFELARVEKEGD
ncbi:MAG: VCBS repeat-containing protein [Planctomycetia bacterium]|nr:VCBS repeat-containing protein [Planctomycetia bacterium]